MNRIAKKMISVKKAQELQKEWLGHQGKAIEKGLGFQDCSDFTFSVKEMQEYLDFVLKKSQEQGIENPGIRIYLGRYPKTKENPGQATVFLSATRGEKHESSKLLSATRVEKHESSKDDSDGDDDNHDIDPLNTVKGGYPPRIY